MTQFSCNYSLVFLSIMILACETPGDVRQNFEDQTTFFKTFGGNKEEYGFAMDASGDGGYILTGFTTTFGNGSWDVWLVKTDSFGNGVWNRTFGTGEKETGFSVKLTSDGGFIIVGDQGIPGRGGDVLMIKTDELGFEEWKNNFGGSNHDGARCVIQTRDGGYAISGYTYSFGGGGRDMWLIKTDSKGNEEWSKTYGGSYDEMGSSIIQTEDGGYFVLGYQYNPQERKKNLWIVKTSASGNEEWSKRMDRTSENYGYAIKKTNDGMYILAGFTNVLGNDWYDLWLIKMDFSGNIVWDKVYPISNNIINNWFYVDVTPTTDNGFICVAPTTGFGRNLDAILIKVDSQGNIEWSESYGGKREDIGLSVIQAADGGYTFLGRTNSYSNGLYDFFLVKTDSLGFTDVLPQ